jgi:hypothetical protein
MPERKTGPNPGPTASSNPSERLVQWITTVRIGMAQDMVIDMDRGRAFVIR